MSNDTPDQSLIDRVTDALSQGRKIEAIKLYRDATGKDLRDSKQFIDALIPQLIDKDPERFQHLTQRSGCAAAMLLSATLTLTVFALWRF